VRSQLVDVPPLSEDAVASLAGEVLGLRRDDATIREIASVSGGNPFFARELARAASKGLSGGRLPSSLRQVLRNRVVPVGPETRMTLLDVAVRGAIEARGHHLRGLDEAFNADVLTVVDGRMVFTHPLLARAVLETASVADVAAAHRRAADAATDPVTRALHRARCSPAGDDVAAELDAAAEIALRRGDLAGSRLLAQLAVELTPEQPAPVPRLLRLARLESAFDADDRAAELGLQILQLDPTPHERARALMSIAYLHINSDPNAAIEILGQVADIEGVPNADVQSVVADIADALYESGHLEQAVAELTGFLDRLPEITAEHADIVGELSLIRRFCGIPDDGAILRRVIESGQLHDPLSGAYTTATRAIEVAAIVATLADRHDEAQRLLAMAEQSAARLGEKDVAGYFNGLLACRTGNLAEAERQIRRTLSVDEWNPLGWARLALVYTWMGDEAQAREQLDHAELRMMPGWHRRDAEFRYAAAFVDLLAGRYADAWPVLRATAEQLDAVGYREPSHPPVLLAAVEAAAAVGELEAAARLCVRLERDAARLESAFGVAASRRARGYIAQGRGQHDEAEASFADAADRFTAAELPLEAARSLLALGAMLRRTGQRRRARETLQAARETFAACGAHGLLRDADAELARISGRTVTAPSELTESERQVAELVARGLRNADVARSLHLSVKTVETHLGRIYRKLELSSRGELIAAMNRPAR
jgi:DNA-binding CsgD family transcriptional regulator